MDCVWTPKATHDTVGIEEDPGSRLNSLDRCYAPSSYTKRRPRHRGEDRRIPSDHLSQQNGAVATLAGDVVKAAKKQNKIIVSGVARLADASVLYCSGRCGANIYLMCVDWYK